MRDKTQFRCPTWRVIGLLKLLLAHIHSLSLSLSIFQSLIIRFESEHKLKSIDLNISFVNDMCTRRAIIYILKLLLNFSFVCRFFVYIESVLKGKKNGSTHKLLTSFFSSGVFYLIKNKMSLLMSFTGWLVLKFFNSFRL